MIISEILLYLRGSFHHKAGIRGPSGSNKASVPQSRALEGESGAAVVSATTWLKQAAARNAANGAIVTKVQRGARLQ